MNHAGSVISVRERWSWTCKIYNKTGNPKSTAGFLRELEQAYTRNGQDLVLEHSDGTPSYHALLSRDCIGGTRVVQLPVYPRGQGGEYVSFRTVSIAVEGIRPVLNGVSLYLAFQERITISGGGARWGCREVNRGPGQRQQLRTHSKCEATQTGSATLYVGEPEVPSPIWPQALVDQYPALDAVGPETISAGSIGDSAFVNRSVTWSYSYEFPYRLFGEPHYLLR